jgi:hypothetical protein
MTGQNHCPVQAVERHEYCLGSSRRVGARPVPAAATSNSAISVRASRTPVRIVIAAPMYPARRPIPGDPNPKESPLAAETGRLVSPTAGTTEFWMRVDSASGIAVLAEGRNEANTG